MKRPTPRQFGLNSDLAPHVTSAVNIAVDPDQPFTQDELHAALTSLVEREALANRQREYSHALSLWEYNNGGR